MKNRIIKTAAVLTIAGLALTGCDSSNSYDDRVEQQNTVTLKDSLEKANLEEKLQRENDPNATRYVYLMNFGQIVGYYVIKGKVSSAGSQLAPEQEVVRRCSGCDAHVVDSAQDDGTFGTGDPGIFFFTADGTMVSTSLDYIEADSLLPIDVPRLSAK